MEDGLIAKLLGVASGAFLALVFDPPRSRMGFARRTAAAIVAGYIFGHVVLTFMEWPETYENVVAAFCTSAFLSWAAMGRVKKLVESYRKET